MNHNTFEMIRKYGQELAAMDGLAKESCKIFVKVDQQTFATRSGADFTNLQLEDIVDAAEESDEYPLEYGLLMEENENNALVLSRTPYCTLAGKRGRPLTAALDDMAQIVGWQVEATAYEGEPVRKALEQAAACFVKDRYTITVGRNLYEAVVALTVLEKCAEVDDRAQSIGGVIHISRAEGTLMRAIYKNKYSKTEQEVKAKEGSCHDE